MKKMCALCVLAIVSALACIGCVETTPIRYTTPLDKTQMERMLRSGRNTIIVNAFTKDPNDGSIATCAGRSVELIPATERAAEYTKIIFGSVEGGKQAGGDFNRTVGRIVADPDFQARFETCDSDGFATIKNVADGEFYVFVGAGGYVYGGKVNVRGGESETVILSGTAQEYSRGFNYEHWERYERRRAWEARQRNR
ncbi:MAG: hypothetical protein LBV79_12450 [Candidatus Adiutrix sp.]|jgi:hypothetical protein|nr:hypothetical protein [Candidatus Adiutrix sp.]